MHIRFVELNASRADDWEPLNEQSAEGTLFHTFRWKRLFVSDKGMDAARALYMDMTGQQVIPENVPEGRKWLIEDVDLRACIRYHADAKLNQSVA